MQIIKCKACGGDMELSPDKSYGICEYCGSTMTLPKVDEEQRAASFNRGNHFRRLGEFDKALSVYERLVQEDEHDAEAHWCCALCRFGIDYVQDPTTGECLPTCHRASFESFLEDVDYKAAIENADAAAKEHYIKGGTQIADVQKHLLATIQREDPFDVFICYKESGDNGQRTIDSTLAQEIYYQLTEQNYRTFFARITLEDKAGQEYEPYIFAALNSAKVMVVVGTKPEYFDAVWVRNEWSRFLALMKTDRTKLLVPCYRDMDPYDLPERLSVLQSYDMSKIGFIQDLIRGISKVINAGKGPEIPARQPSSFDQGVNVTALLKRGYMSLEDNDWSKADNFFEQVLNADAENAEAYYGKLLASQRCENDDKLIQKHLAQSSVNEIYQELKRYDATTHSQAKTIKVCDESSTRIESIVKGLTIPKYLLGEKIRELFEGFDFTMKSVTSHIQAGLDREKKFFENDKLMGRAVKYAEGVFLTRMQNTRDTIIEKFTETLALSKESDKRNTEKIRSRYEAFLEEGEREAKVMHEAAVEKQEDDYQAASALLAQAQSTDGLVAVPIFLEASEQFAAIGDYKDCQSKVSECGALAKERENSAAYKEVEMEMERAALSEGMAGYRAYRQVAQKFDSLADYRDSAERAEVCRRKADEIRKDIQNEAESSRQIELHQAMEKVRLEKRKARVNSFAFLLGILGFIALIIFIIKGLSS